MLKLARTNSDDVIFDLGCGDGRILIMAVNEFSVKKAVGYEMRPELCRETLKNVIQMGLSGRIVLYNKDLLEADIREATVITVYLTTDGNEKLRPKLTNDAPMGARIVSHDFIFNEWKPTAFEELGDHTLYLYTVPKSHSTLETT
jgi:methylase of polypeptide subunit release factors